MNLIDKDALVAEIEKRLKYNSTRAEIDRSAVMAGRGKEDEDILSLLDTLEVKEVGLEKEQMINDALELIFAYSLIPYKDGNQWCVLLGKNIQEGICGFGNTRLDAIMNFCKEYNSYPYSIAEFLISNGYV